jgi:DNA-binding beta-propeller fold protein YncE
MRLSLLALAFAAAAQAQAPVNDKPNPYQTIEGWAKMPEGRTWGSTSAVDIDKDGTSIWVAERCGANNCVGSTLDPILKFDKDGKLVKSFGAGLIQSPHGITVDRDGNVWVVDCSCTIGGRGAAAAAAPAPTTGHQVYKFSPDGKLLMTLGKPGGGRDTAFFWQPNDVLVAPNGDIYVAEGHSSNAAASARIYKFDRTGKLLRTLGSWGKSADADKFDQPHALAMDSRGRLFVADRGNNLLKIFDQDFKLLDVWTQFSRISGLAIRNDTLYAADSESGSVSRDSTGAKNRLEWKRGIRIGSARTGEVWAFIPDPAENPPSTSAAEGVAVDKNGVIYGAEVGPRALKRYVKKP